MSVFAQHLRMNYSIEQYGRQHVIRPPAGTPTASQTRPHHLSLCQAIRPRSAPPLGLLLCSYGFNNPIHANHPNLSLDAQPNPSRPLLQPSGTPGWAQNWPACFMPLTPTESVYPTCSLTHSLFPSLRLSSL